MVLVEGGRVALVTSQVVLELCEEESCKLVALSAAHSGTVTTRSLQAAEPVHCSCCTDLSPEVIDGFVYRFQSDLSL